MLQPPSPQRAPVNKRTAMPVAAMWPYDHGFPNEQWALYQTIRRAHEALSVIL